MTTSAQTRMTSEISSHESLSKNTIEYFRERLKNRFYDAVLNEYFYQVKSSKIKKTHIANRLGKEPSQITRLLQSPGNLTLKTISDLLLALECEPAIAIKRIVTIQIGDQDIVEPQSVSRVIDTNGAGYFSSGSQGPALVFTMSGNSVAMEHGTYLKDSSPVGTRINALPFSEARTTL